MELLKKKADHETLFPLVIYEFSQYFKRGESPETDGVKNLTTLTDVGWVGTNAKPHIILDFVTPYVVKKEERQDCGGSQL